MTEHNQIESLKNITTFVKEISPTDRLEVYQDIARIVDFLITDKKLHERPSPETIKMFEQVSKSMTSMQEHLERQDENISEIKTILIPISKTYDGISFMGGTTMKILLVISVLIGVIAGLFSFLKPIIQKLV